MESTPDNVILELKRIQADLEKAPDALFTAETKLAELEAELDKAESLAMLRAEGSTVADRQSIAKIEVSSIRLARDIARAELNRVKMKIKVLESASMATAVIGRQVEIMYKTA
jgi:hypothetical protein